MAVRNMKPGDWICEACNNHNFASRQVCNKCAAPNTTSGGSGGGAYNTPSGNGYGPAPRAAAAAAAAAPPHAAPYSSAKPMAEGDWMCPQCNNHNFASRVNCKRCSVLRQGMKQGDWICRSCRNHNYASRQACNKCRVPRPVEEGGIGLGLGGRLPMSSLLGMGLPMDVMGMGLGMQPWLGGLGGSTLGPQGRTGGKPGDWVCPACANHNYASRVNCNGCGQLRHGFKQGDWVCRGCRNHNYASRQDCNKCNAAKPA